MPWCPNCKVEYQPGFKTCIDCDLPLCDQLTPEPESAAPAPAYAGDALLVSAADSVEAEILESFLKAQGIPVLKKYPEAGGFLDIYMGTTAFGIDLYVPVDRLDEARDIVAGCRESAVEGAEPPGGEDRYYGRKFRKQQQARTWIILLFFIPGVFWLIASTLMAIFHETGGIPGLFWLMIIALGIVLANFLQGKDNGDSGK
jgi:hypothetical protein